MTRRLAAILAADLAGYSRLMHENEEATHARLSAAMHSIVAPAVARHGGRIVKSTGDGFLAEFVSAVAAVRCGLEFQRAMADEATIQPPEQRLLFRVGIDVGDVIAEENDIYGDHVNLASRLEQLAEPGGISISSFVHEYVRGRVTCRFEDIGEQHLKNIARPVRTYRVLTETAPAPSTSPPTEPERQILRLRLLGQVSVWVGEQQVQIRSRKLRALLGYLALSESSYESRERLVGVLWSESSEDQARAVLRQVVRELRTLFGEVPNPALRISAREIALDRSAVEVDIWAVIEAAEAGEAHPLLLQHPHLTEELLAGLEDVDPAFRGWLLAKRHTLRDRLLRSLEAAAAGANGRDQARLAEAILNLDPTHEDACRQLMRARAIAGDTAGALRAYKALWDLLDEDFGMEPAAATQELVAQIKLGSLEPIAAPRGGTERRPTAETSASPGRGGNEPTVGTFPETRLMLSVQPSVVHGVEPDKAHLVLGFRQLLIASLVRFRELLVTDAPSSSSAEPINATGRYDLQLVAQQSRESIHLTIMLKELATGFYIWSDGFELKLENWFESQRRVVQRIAMALNVYLSTDRLQRFSERPDIGLGIYDRWLRCQTLVRTFDPRQWGRLTQQFTEIVANAPAFVPAYCGLADMHSIEHIAHPGVFRTREREQKALELARKAVQLDPSDMRAHRSLAWAHAMAGQYGSAEMHIGVAGELNPNDSWTAISGALLLAFCGHSSRAHELAKVALDLTLSPTRTHWAYQADIEFLAGNYAAAVEAADRAQDVLWGVAAWRASALSQLGRHAEAAAEGQRFLARIRTNWFGEAEPTDEMIVRWLLHLYPIARPTDWARLRDGLRDASLPVGQMEHGEW